MKNSTRKEFNYTGKTVFVGIDVHKKTYSVSAICDGVIVKRDTLRALPRLLIDYLKKHFGTGTILTAYESGFSGFHLHRALEAAHIKNIVVHAAAIEISNDRVKTDKRDSLKIAAHLSQNRLKGIHVPTVERKDMRSLTRLRDSFCRDKTRLACQIKSLMYMHGLIDSNDDKRVSEKWIRNLSISRATPTVKYAIELMVSMWLTFNDKFKEINEKIKEQAIQDKELDVTYQSVPGIGLTSARILANELIDLTHFKNEGQLFSYLGFTPSEYSSGEHIRQGHITKQGKPILRKILVQAAWVAIRNDKELQQVFDRISSRAGPKRAIVAIARKLIGRIRACFKTGTLYKEREAKEVEVEYVTEPYTAESPKKKSPKKINNKIKQVA